MKVTIGMILITTWFVLSVQAQFGLTGNLSQFPTFGKNNHIFFDRLLKSISLKFNIAQVIDPLDD